MKIRCPKGGGKRRQGNLRMRLEDYVKRHLERVGGEWKITTTYRRGWRLLIENAVREKLKKKR